MIIDTNGKPVTNGHVEIHPVMEKRAVLRPLQPRDQKEAQELPQVLAALHEKAADDDHMVIAPTHVMVKGGEIIGYLSLAGMPMVHAWFDSGHKHVNDSLKMIEHGETVLRANPQVRQYTICCAEESPFSPLMPGMGFKKLGTTTVWMKEL
jgi:hypothetical protein